MPYFGDAKKCFYAIFALSTVVTLAFIGVAGAAAGNTRRSFIQQSTAAASLEACTNLASEYDLSNLCLSVKWATGCLYFSIVTLIVVTVVNVTITTMFLCSTMVFASSGNGYAFGLTAGLSGYSSIANILVVSQLLGSMYLFKFIDETWSVQRYDSGWDESMYTTAAVLGGLASVVQLIVTTFLICCGSQMGAAGTHSDLDSGGPDPSRFEPPPPL